MNNESLIDEVLDSLVVAKKAHLLMPVLPDGIKPDYIRVLNVIFKIRDDSGSIHVSDISKAMGSLSPNTTKIINEMVSLELVKKEELPTDKRVVLVKAAELGEHYIQTYVAKYGSILQEEFLKLGEDNCKIMIDMINKVYGVLKEVYSKNQL